MKTSQANSTRTFTTGIISNDKNGKIVLRVSNARDPEDRIEKLKADGFQVYDHFTMEPSTYAKAHTEAIGYLMKKVALLELG